MYRIVLLVLCTCALQNVFTDDDSELGCGVSNLISNDDDRGPHPVAPGNFPWYAAIYKRTKENEDHWEIICGGTLITPRSVLTAASCIEWMDSENIKVALGKLKRNWNDNEPNEIKKNVNEIRVHENYMGWITFFKDNVALLILESEVPIRNFVCLVQNPESIQNHLQTGGFVVGWGLQERIQMVGESQSEELRYGRTSVMDREVCLQSLNFTKFVIPKDVYCNATELIPHGFPNLGTGLTFVSAGHHYLYGFLAKSDLMSRGVKFVASYANVSYHYDWIKDHMK